jgi:hypothetical protein
MNRIVMSNNGNQNLQYNSSQGMMNRMNMPNNVPGQNIQVRQNLPQTANSIGPNPGYSLMDNSMNLLMNNMNSFPGGNSQTQMVSSNGVQDYDPFVNNNSSNNGNRMRNPNVPLNSGNLNIVTGNSPMLGNNLNMMTRTQGK